MSTFDESKIRRGQPDNAGKFAAKHNSAPDRKLPTKPGQPVKPAQPPAQPPAQFAFTPSSMQSWSAKGRDLQKVLSVPHPNQTYRERLRHMKRLREENPWLDTMGVRVKTQKNKAEYESRLRKKVNDGDVYRDAVQRANIESFEEMYRKHHGAYEHPSAQQVFEDAWTDPENEFGEDRTRARLTSLKEQQKAAPTKKQKESFHPMIVAAEQALTTRGRSVTALAEHALRAQSAGCSHPQTSNNICQTCSVFVRDERP